MMLLKFCMMLMALFAFSAAMANEPEVHRVSHAQLQEVIGQALVDAGAGDEISATLSNVSGRYYYEGKAPLEAELRFVDFNESTKRWETEMALFEGGELVKTETLNGRFTAMIEVPVLSRRVFSGDVIRAQDLTVARIESHRLRQNVVQDAKQLIGQSARRVLRAGKPIAQHEIEAPNVIHKGDLISLRYSTANIDIQTIAEALQDGAFGKSISVRNTDSGQVLRATVASEGIADIQNHMRLSRNEATEN
jgi:flagella basal body P-ring formation protein FlgA